MLDGSLLFQTYKQNGLKTPKMSKAGRQQHNALCFSQHAEIYPR